MLNLVHIKNPYGKEKVVFYFNGKLNRKDWRLSWNDALETGGVMVKEEGRINGKCSL